MGIDIKEGAIGGFNWSLGLSSRSGSRELGWMAWEVTESQGEVGSFEASGIFAAFPSSAMATFGRLWATPSPG